MTSQARRVPDRMLDILEAIRNVGADVGNMPMSVFLAVWTTIQVSLPPFKASIENYAAGLSEPRGGL